MENLIATTQLHLLRLNAAVAKGGQLAANAHSPARATGRPTSRRSARNWPAPTRTSPAANGTTPTGTVAIPEDDDAIITMVRDDAGNAQVQFTDALGTVSRYRAELLASIAASLATHRTVLGMTSPEPAPSPGFLGGPGRHRRLTGSGDRRRHTGAGAARLAGRRTRSRPCSWH